MFIFIAITWSLLNKVINDKSVNYNQHVTLHKNNNDITDKQQVGHNFFQSNWICCSVLPTIWHHLLYQDIEYVFTKMRRVPFL